MKTRAAIAYAISEESLSVARLREKYQSKFADGPEGRAFDVVTAPIGTNGTEFQDIAKKIASVDTLDAFLNDLRTRDPLIYSRISEVKPVAPNSFGLFDRELGAFVYSDEGDLSARWRDLYAVVRAEHLGKEPAARRGPRVQRDGVLVRPLARQRAHTRLPADRPRRASARGADLRLRARPDPARPRSCGPIPAAGPAGG